MQRRVQLPLAVVLHVMGSRRGGLETACAAGPKHRHVGALDV